MPDVNKFKKLREIGYRIPKLCVYCTHSYFGEQALWGTCGLHRYTHKKHDNPDGGRGVSIHVTGTCESGFQVNPRKAGKFALCLLGSHMEFFDGGQGAANGS